MLVHVCSCMNMCKDVCAIMCLHVCVLATVSLLDSAVSVELGIPL